MGDTFGVVKPGDEGHVLPPRRVGDRGPRNPDGTWVAGVERGPYKDFPFPIGAVFGAFTLIDWRRAELYRGTEKGWHPFVRCACGWEGFVGRSNLLRGRSTRCNTCSKKKGTETRKTFFEYASVIDDATHRMRILNRICSIVARCENPQSKIYPDYGGRGIRVHKPWLEKRADFVRYLITLDGWDKPELQLDRIDNNKGYEPGNLRFCTRSVNMSNKRKILARDVEELKKRIADLEKENADLRHK